MGVKPEVGERKRRRNHEEGDQIREPGTGEKRRCSPVGGKKNLKCLVETQWPKEKNWERGEALDDNVLGKLGEEKTN